MWSYLFLLLFISMQGDITQRDTDSVLQIGIDNMKNKDLADLAKTVEEIKATVEILKAPPKPDCYTPPFLPGADVTFSTTTVGSTAIYSCKAGFRMYGGSASTATCQSNRMWSLVDLRCTDLTNCYTRASNNRVQYRGTITTTAGGITCQAWVSNYPHGHKFTNHNDMSGWGTETSAAAKNYCRDPDNEGKLWCYTTSRKIRWDFCRMPPPCTTTPYWVN